MSELTEEVSIKLPERKRGRRTVSEEETYRADLGAFCRGILEIQSRLDFKVSTRGWAYILENQGVITKGDFDSVERLINECRKSGLLPLDISAEDSGREAEGLEVIDYCSPEGYARSLVNDILQRVSWYTPRSFWDKQKYYVEVMVEKVDLKSLFKDVCLDFCVPITNARGWSDLNSRAAIMKRFGQNEREGRRCVLLYCGDHDPAGLAISGFIRSNMEELSKALQWNPANLIIDRFGLNYDFIMQNNLTWIDNLETSGKGPGGQKKRLDDPGHPDHGKPYVQDYLRQFGARKVEANALVVRSAEGRELCRQAILKYVDEDSAQEYNEYLEEQQELSRAVLPAVIREYLEGEE